MSLSISGVTFHSHGHKLLGTFFGAAGEGPRPTVLMMHGIPGVEKNFDLAYALREAGWNALAFHYRGCWGSEGAYSLPGTLDDITAALDYLCGLPSVDTSRLAGVGLSLGGWGVIMAAARDERLRAIVCLNPLVDPKTCPLDEETASAFVSMLNGLAPAEAQAQWDALTPLPRVAHRLAGRPTLLLTADEDEIFPPAHIQPLADALPRETSEWRRVPGANHTFNDHRRVMIRGVIDWLTLTFSPAPPHPHTYALRSPLESDHPRVLAVLSDWWGGRDLSHLLPRLYFQHFNDTSFIVEAGGELAAFLIGFVSPSEPGVAYIHFVGVHPAHRQAGLARLLYERFFRAARARGASEVHCITSPVNSVSIAFHKRMGFVASEPIADYDGLGDDRVALKRKL
ncbi:MAG: GNAT family N-acetyltransferase [Chloroflexi bacterium]|nr:GNAT family N-acetyltransferase [Chloroflexota bacterium]